MDKWNSCGIGDPGNCLCDTFHGAWQIRWSTKHDRCTKLEVRRRSVDHLSDLKQHWTYSATDEKTDVNYFRILASLAVLIRLKINNPWEGQDQVKLTITDCLQRIFFFRCLCRRRYTEISIIPLILNLKEEIPADFLIFQFVSCSLRPVFIFLTVSAVFNSDSTLALFELIIDMIIVKDKSCVWQGW